MADVFAAHRRSARIGGVDLVIILGLCLLIVGFLVVLVRGLYQNVREVFVNRAAKRRLLREVGELFGAARAGAKRVRGIYRGWPVQVSYTLRLDTGQGRSLEWMTISMPLPEGRPFALRLVQRRGGFGAPGSGLLDRWALDGAPAALARKLVADNEETLDALGSPELTTSGDTLELHKEGWTHSKEQVREALEAQVSLLEQLEAACRALDREAGMDVEGAPYREDRVAAQERRRKELTVEVRRTQVALRWRAAGRLLAGVAALSFALWYLLGTR